MFCDCLNMLPNGNFRAKVRVNTYADGICENCHHYASNSADSRVGVDADIDITKSQNCVTSWHREVKKLSKIKPKSAVKLTLDEQLEIIELGSRGITNDTLAARYNVGTSTISNIFKRRGVIRPRGRRTDINRGVCNGQI